MARLPYVEAEGAPEKVREVLEAAPVRLNIFKMMAHAENMLRPLLRLGISILSEQKLDPKLREFAILQAAKLTPGEYEWVQHVPIAKGTGASDEQIEALERGDLGAACFDEVEQLVLRFNADVMERSQVSDDLFAAMEKRFTPREIVELLLTLGYYAMLARMTEVTKTDVDPPAGSRIIDALKG